MSDNTVVLVQEGNAVQLLQSNSTTTVEKEDIVTTSTDNSTVVSITQVDTVVVNTETQSYVPAGQPGPKGEPGVTEEDKVYSKRIDFITDNELYRGEAVPGSAESATVWRIRKISIASDNDVVELWASGTDYFDKSWSDRALYSYL